MATYDNDLRLKEITTGDEDGTWGTSTNTNLELIADSFSYGTKAIPSNANTTFTMADAASDTTRSFYLKITSAVSLTATRTVTLGPNTISKVWLIENATTGGQSITISQGSGANVTVPNGSKVFIATDGNGVGAAVYNANPTEVGGTVTSVGGTGTINGISLSGTVTSSGNLTLGGALTGVNLTSQVTGTLPVANGGTGATTLTANNVILGNGTSAVQAVAPGTSGNVLTSNGTTWTSAAAGAALIGETDSATPFLTALGGGAGAAMTAGALDNTVVGFSSLCTNQFGDRNTVVGSCNLQIATADENIAIGVCNANSLTTAGGTISIGACALANNTTGCGIIAIGRCALFCNTVGNNAIAIGHRALYNSCIPFTFNNNVAVGDSALCSVLTGCHNVGLGSNAGGKVTNGSYNIAIGQASMMGLGCFIGGCNIAIGRCAAGSCIAGNHATSNNIVIGLNAGYFMNNSSCPYRGYVDVASPTVLCNHIILGNIAHTCAMVPVGWTTVSDCRDKSCFKEVPHGLDFVNALKPTEYQFKKVRDSEETDGITRYGFLAQDVIALEGDSPVVASANDPDKLKYTEAHMVPILVKAIQELSAEVKRLKES
jgi:trimeric autotransporter adhesin